LTVLKVNGKLPVPNTFMMILHYVYLPKTIY